MVGRNCDAARGLLRGTGGSPVRVGIGHGRAARATVEGIGLGARFGRGGAAVGGDIEDGFGGRRAIAEEMSCEG
jgi:hypothetical protein